MTGVEIIAAERKRQVEVEGWTPEHDDEHADGDLAVVAASLAVDGTDATVRDPLDRGSPVVSLPVSYADHGGLDESGDCWGLVAKHRGNRINQLAIAGALIAAEIDRLQRQGDAK